MWALDRRRTIKCDPRGRHITAANNHPIMIAEKYRIAKNMPNFDS
jgi:hypothetical protein